MRGLNRRTFIQGILAAALGGCASGFYMGGGERVTDTSRRPVPIEDPPRRPAVDIADKEPVYASAAHDSWVPDLTPIPRKVWAENTPLGDKLTLMDRVTRITIHHEGAAAPNLHTNIGDVIRDLRDIRKYHVREMNAGDIGYHYIIDRMGRIWEGRPRKYRGAHAGGDANRGNLGVVLLGNFDLQTPSARQAKALDMFLPVLMASNHVIASQVFTHRELKPTRCPGDSLQKHIVVLRAGMV